MRSVRNFKIVLVCLLVMGCGGGKNISSSKINKDLNARETIKNYRENLPDFTTLVSRVQIDYDDGKNFNRITVNLRMKNKEALWASASIVGWPIAKMLITPNRVSYYESIDNTFFDGNFQLLSNWLGVDIDFNMAQNILLGNSVFDLDENTYNLNIVEKTYQLKPKKRDPKFQHAVYLNEFFKVKRQQIFQNDEGRVLTIDYPEYQKQGNTIFPKKIALEVREPEGVTTVQLEYRSIELNANISFPFEIPKGYQEIIFD